jgi:hypothetical protein
MTRYIRGGGAMRLVVHFKPRPAVAFEFIDGDGKPVELYRFEGRAGHADQRTLN